MKNTIEDKHYKKALKNKIIIIFPNKNFPKGNTYMRLKNMNQIKF